MIVVSGTKRQEQALDTALISDKFRPLGASVQEAMITAAGTTPWRLRIGATGAGVIVIVTVLLGTVATASVISVRVAVTITVLRTCQ